MKKSVILVLLCTIVGFGQTYAQTKADTIKVQVKIKELKQTELTLKKRIETEDKKRNRTIEGVSEISMSDINERQDSICLGLRSQLVDVQLQVKELELSIKPVTLTPEQAAANLHQGLSTIPAASSNSGKPTKTLKKQTKK
ncbi:MAG: hypothetical protein K2M96_09650 [Prevotella sp.]|nr:hypothetical protein [Prevotella sp.]